MSKLVLVALLLTGTADANTIAIKQEVAARLDKAGLLTNGDGLKCQYWNLPDKVVVGCFGPERARYYREVMRVLVDPTKKIVMDLNPENKYSALLNSGHVEVR